MDNHKLTPFRRGMIQGTTTAFFLVAIIVVAIATRTEAQIDNAGGGQDDAEPGSVDGVYHGNNPLTWNGIPITEELRLAFKLFEAATGSSVWAAATPVEQCTEAALTACGQGHICCVKVTAGGNGAQSCTYCCHDGDGKCGHCLICYPPATD